MLVSDFDVLLLVKPVVLQVFKQWFVATESLSQRHELIVVPVDTKNGFQPEIVLAEEGPMLSGAFATNKYAVANEDVSGFLGLAVDAELVITIGVLLAHVDLDRLGHRIVRTLERVGVKEAVGRFLVALECFF